MYIGSASEMQEALEMQSSGSDDEDKTRQKQMRATRNGK